MEQTQITEQTQIPYTSSVVIHTAGKHQKEEDFLDECQSLLLSRYDLWSVYFVQGDDVQPYAVLRVLERQSVDIAGGSTLSAEYKVERFY